MSCRLPLTLAVTPRTRPSLPVNTPSTCTP